MRRQGRADDPAAGELKGALDALLAGRAGHRARPQSAQSPAPQPKSPVDLLRERFAERLVPISNKVAERYRDRGIDVGVDASDFLAGGRGLSIEITYEAHRLILEGTVVSEGVAFQETRYISGRGGTVTGGPMIRSQGLTEQGFADFLYDRIISLVKDANAEGGG